MQAQKTDFSIRIWPGKKEYEDKARGLLPSNNEHIAADQPASAYMPFYGDNCTYIEYMDSYHPVPSDKKMFVGYRIHHRMVDAMKLTVVLSIAGTMI